MPIEGSAAEKVHGVVRGVGSTVMGAVLGTLAQGVAGSTEAPQCRGWLSSDQSWRMGFQSQPLCDMVA